MRTKVKDLSCGVQRRGRVWIRWVRKSGRRGRGGGASSGWGRVARSGGVTRGSTHLEDGDLDGDDHAGLVLGPGVVLLAEHHDVHTLEEEGGGGGEVSGRCSDVASGCRE